ncbi:MAG: hypothetical protein NWF05_06365 [Candidatus Bathyarchaeota archaeon]|nr:hypothetical protein [Candidatus Bathyarchaeota archaeon]
MQVMKWAGGTKKVLCVSAAFLLVFSFVAASVLFVPEPEESVFPDVFVGVDAAFATVEETKQIIDQVKEYTNFFVVGSTAITWDVENLTEVCQYLNDSGLHFLTFAHSAADQYFSQRQWVKDAQQKWNARFLGLYAYDEPGGHQIDHDYMFMCAQKAADYTDAAVKYVQNLTYYLNDLKGEWEIGDLPLFTSDYALHEFTYRGGYDVVFTEFSWNSNRQLNVALGRGAASVHGKDWGVMITRNINDPTPQTGQELYEDMVLAYQNGAKYIVVFDYPSLQQGILNQEHFDALKQFWEYLQSHPRSQTPAADRVAYVVPKDYGYGFRGPADKIWGLWEADSQSAPIWNQANSLLQEYGTGLDVIYEDCLKLNLSAYGKLVFWNGTTLTV